MATNTENYNLVKPDESDYYDIGIQNDNMDKIDAELKKAQDHRENTSNPHQVTAEQTGAIPSSEKGVPNGVPTLNGDGYVEQLPTFAPALLYGLNWRLWNVFVDDNGDDINGNGTDPHPFKTVNRALEEFSYPCLTITVPPDKTITITEPIYVSNRQLNFYYGVGTDTGGKIIIDSEIYLVNSSISFQGMTIIMKNNGMVYPTGLCSFNFGGYYYTDLQIADDVTAPKDFIKIANTDLFNRNGFESVALFIQSCRFRLHAGINLVSTKFGTMSPMVFCKIGDGVVIEDGAFLFNNANNKSQIGNSKTYVLY